MAYAQRKVASDMLVLKIISGATTTDLVTTFKDVSHGRTVAEVDVGAVKDTFRLVKAGRTTGSFTGTCASEGAAIAGMTAGLVVGFSHDMNGGLSGSALITSVTDASGGLDGAQTIAWSMMQVA